MSEQLLEALETAFADQGMAAQRAGAAIHVPDGLSVEPRLTHRGTDRGAVQVLVDFVIGSPHMRGIPFTDSFAGVGEDEAGAGMNALEKFMQGSFGVIANALAGRTRDADEVEWETWEGPGHAWRVCSGPLLMVSSRGGSKIEGFEEFFPRLNALFSETMSSGPHWMRLFLGSLDGKHTGSEVLVDGELWAAGQQLLDAQSWTCPTGYASIRHLLIALPGDV